MGKGVLTVGVLIFAVACEMGWYEEDGRRATAWADRYEVWAKALRMIQVEVIVAPPAATFESESLYLYGRAPSFGGKDPAGVRLVRYADGTHRVTLELLSGMRHPFCVTRGNNESIEADPTHVSP